MKDDDEMLENYDIESLNPRPNPYAKKLRKSVTININIKVIEYFKDMASASGIPYQTLMNMYLEDCMNEKKKLKVSWD